MKKTIFLIFSMGMCAVLLAQAPVRPILAVVEFSTNIKNEKIIGDSAAIRNWVESHMTKTNKYQMMDRSEIDKLLANQKIQASDISSDKNIEKLQLTNVGYIVTGSVDAVGDDYTVTVKIINVSNGRIHSDTAPQWEATPKNCSPE